jgi:uncharacterized protein YkwD
VTLRRWARLSLPALLLLIAACQAPFSSTVTSSPAPSIDSRLAAADSAFYQGNYDAAQSAYQRLVQSNVAGADSHLATLYDYEGRYAEAVTQAQQAAGAHPDSESLARYSRALDWSDDVAAAVEVGARAVAAQPAHPLARIAYAEALSDSGRLEEARQQLLAAERMPADAFAKAEIERGWALYDNGVQDPASQLNHILLARKYQPQFPERDISLARFDLAHSKNQDAGKILDQVASRGQHNYRVLVSAADSAFLGGDLQRAQRYYSTAAQLMPNGSEAAVGYAEVLLLGRKDAGAAHDVLAQAAGRSNSGELAQFLRQLDILILKRNPDIDLAASATAAAAGSAADSAKAALQAVNSKRGAAGLAALTEDPSLDQAAQAHAYYYLFNLADPAVSGATAHNESSKNAGYTGDDPLARSRRFGFAGGRVGEVIDHTYTPNAAVNDWMDAPVQRLQALTPEAQTAGYGEAKVGAFSITVLELGEAAPGSAQASVYPPEGASVPAVFNGNVTPSPLPASTAYPVGYPVTIQVGGAQKLTVSTAKMAGPGGADVATTPLDPTQLSPSQWGVVPTHPLTAGATYSVAVTGTVDGQPYSKTWSFKVVSK